MNQQTPSSKTVFIPLIHRSVDKNASALNKRKAFIIIK